MGEKKVNNSYTFKLNTNTNNNILHLDVRPGSALNNGDVIANLEDNLYRTEVGGIVTYTLEKNQTAKKKKALRKLFSGVFYWIPEETHQLKNSLLLKTVKVKNGSFILPGTELFPDTFSKVGGLVNIDDNLGIYNDWYLFSLGTPFCRCRSTFTL